MRVLSTHWPTNFISSRGLSIHGTFRKSFTLPATADANKIQARFEAGVLELYLPKTALAKPRQIEIQSESTDALTSKPS